MTTAHSALGSVLELVAASDAAGSLAAVQVRLGRGEATPLHEHEADEAIRVLEGQVVVRSGAESVVLEPGSTHLVPGGVAHSLATVDGARYLTATFTELVEGYARFQLAASEAGAGESDEDAALLAGLAAAAGITLLVREPISTV